MFEHPAVVEQMVGENISAVVLILAFQNVPLFHSCYIRNYVPGNFSYREWNYPRNYISYQAHMFQQENEHSVYDFSMLIFWRTWHRCSYRNAGQFFCSKSKEFAWSKAVLRSWVFSRRRCRISGDAIPSMKESRTSISHVCDCWASEVLGGI